MKGNGEEKSFEEAVAGHKDGLDAVCLYLSVLIQQCERSKAALKTCEIQQQLLSSTNECLIYVDMQNKIKFVSNSAIYLFNSKTKAIIDKNIHELISLQNPEIGLMIKNAMMQTQNEFMVIENIWFNLPPKSKPQGKFLLSINHIQTQA